MGANPLTSAHDRAFALASSGNYLLWPNVAHALASEGFRAAAIKQIGKDSAVQREITERILAAEKARRARPPKHSIRGGEITARNRDKRRSGSGLAKGRIGAGCRL
jgi:hypothetical protein